MRNYYFAFSVATATLLFTLAPDTTWNHEAPTNSNLLDCGNIESDRKARVYYKDGDQIVIRSLSGHENRLSVNVFKDVLVRHLQFKPSTKLKPFSPEYVTALGPLRNRQFTNTDFRRREIKERLVGLQTIFEANEDVSDLLSKASKELTSAGRETYATAKVNELIQSWVDSQIAGAKDFHCLSIAGPNSKLTQMNKEIVDNLLQLYEAAAGECHKKCSSAPGGTKTTSQGVTWELVARKRGATGRFYEVWKDSKTGMLWGDRLDSRYTHDNFYPQDGYRYAVKLDEKNGRVIEETTCRSKEGKMANAELSGRDFRLPTIGEFEVAEAHGIREVAPNLGEYWFWSASLYPRSQVVAHGYYGGGQSEFGPRHFDYSVRCVAPSR